MKWDGLLLRLATLLALILASSAGRLHYSSKNTAIGRQLDHAIVRRDTPENKSQETIKESRVDKVIEPGLNADAIKKNEENLESKKKYEPKKHSDKDETIKSKNAFFDLLDDDYQDNNTFVDNEPPPLVSTAQGVLQGLRNHFNGTTFSSFLGIPYASPPERFQAPKPPEPWNGTRIAIRCGNVCNQWAAVVNLIVGSEDCLYLDVHTPSMNVSGLPVMAVVHGGAWKYLGGTSYFYDPSLIMANAKMVVVTFNYRLGAFGYLSTRTADAPGNAGMKDIVAAFEWIQMNIHMFGGDPNRVTAYGVSSGAAAIEYLMLSKMARGLFSRVIMQSASALNHINYQKEPLKYAFRLGKQLGCDTMDSETLIKYLRNVSADAIVEATDRVDFNNSVMTNSFSFVPCAEDPIPGERIFLHDHPFNIMRSGDFTDVPTMIGFNSVEGSEMIKRIYVDPKFFNSLDSSFEYIMPNDLMESVDSHLEKRALMKKARDFYFNGKKVSNETLRGCVDLLGDTTFLTGLFRSVNIRLRTSSSPIYYWHFAFARENPLINELGIEGSPHADDVSYVFKMPFTEEIRKEKETAIASLRIIKMLTNFMIYGNPTPNVTSLLPVTWKPIQSAETLDYLELTNEVKMKQNPYKERRIFWEGLYYKKFGAV